MLESKLSIELDEQIIDQLQTVGLEPWEFEKVLPMALAIELYRNNWISLGQGTMVADIDLSEFMEALAERNTPIVSLPDEEITKEIERVKAMIGEE